jgi:hypothetical protein
VRLKGLGELEKLKNLIRTKNRSLPACSIVPQPCGTQGIKPVAVYGGASWNNSKQILAQH